MVRTDILKIGSSGSGVPWVSHPPACQREVTLRRPPDLRFPTGPFHPKRHHPSLQHFDFPDVHTPLFPVFSLFGRLFHLYPHKAEIASCLCPFGIPGLTGVLGNMHGINIEKLKNAMVSLFMHICLVWAKYPVQTAKPYHFSNERKTSMHPKMGKHKKYRRQWVCRGMGGRGPPAGRSIKRWNARAICSALSSSDEIPMQLAAPFHQSMKCPCRRHGGFIRRWKAGATEFGETCLGDPIRITKRAKPSGRRSIQLTVRKDINLNYMIYKLKFTNLRNNEFLQFMTDSLVVVAQNDPAALQVSDLYAALQQQVQEADKMLKVRRGHILSRTLAEYDARREAALTGMQRTMEGARYSPLPAEREAAERLQNHFAGFGKYLTKYNYQGQTAVVRNLIAELSEDSQLQAAVTALGMQKWVDELQTVNTQFQAGFVNRATDMGNSTPQSLGLKRMAITSVWHKMERRLNAHFEISGGGAPWSDAIAGLNGVIENYQALLARRQQGLPDEEDSVTEESTEGTDA